MKSSPQGTIEFKNISFSYPSRPNIKVLNNETRFTSKYKLNEILKINIAHNEGNFYTDKAHLRQLKEENLIAFKSVESNTNISKISVIGMGMMSQSGVAKKMFTTLAENSINILAISTSELK